MRRNINIRQAWSSAVLPEWLIHGWYQLAQPILLILAFASIILFLMLAGIRMFYPFELEWIEGGYLDHIRWLAQGNALYPEPSILFIPFNKTPFFFIVSALLTHVTGISFVAPRLISTLATCGSCGLLFLLVRYQTRSVPGGIIAAGMYTAAFRLTGSWMDIARPDALCLFFVLLGFWISRRSGGSFTGLLGGGICYLLAYYTKQIALPVILTIAGYDLLRAWQKSWLPWALTAMSGAVLFWLLDWTSDGWFSFYTFNTIADKRWVEDIWHFWKLLFMHTWPVLFLSLLIFVYALIEMRRYRREHNTVSATISLLPPIWGYLALAGGLLGSSWSVSLQIWTYDNGLMPVMLGLCLLAGVAVGLVGMLHHVWPRYVVLLLQLFVPLLIIWQFRLLAYNPWEQLPTEQDRLAGEQFVAQLAALPGEVLVFQHGFFSYLANKTPYMHSSPFSDAMGGGNNYAGDDDSANARRRSQVRQMWEQVLYGQYFDWIIVDRDPETWLPYYLFAESLFVDNQEVFYPVTGAATRPKSLLVRNPLLRGGTVRFADLETDYLLESGWSVREEWGRWTDGSHAMLEIALEQQDYLLKIEAFPFCHPQFEQQHMTMYWNEQHMGTYTYTTCETRVIIFDLPAAYITMPLNAVRIEIATPTVPSMVSEVNDNRQLGLGFIALTLQPAP